MNVDINSAFSIWAAVVGLLGAAIVWELSRLRGEVRAIGDKLNDYILRMERRVTRIESYLKMSDYGEN